MNRKALNVLICAAAAAASPVLHAASYSCHGAVTNVTVDPTGNVNATFAFDGGQMAWQELCSISREFNNVAPTSCRGILTILLTAKASGQRVMMWFDNDSGGSCSAPSWRPLKERGWYWGPALY